MEQFVHILFTHAFVVHTNLINIIGNRSALGLPSGRNDYTTHYIRLRIPHPNLLHILKGFVVLLPGADFHNL